MDPESEESLLQASIECLAAELKKRIDERRDQPPQVIVTGVPPRQGQLPQPARCSLPALWRPRHQM